MIKLLRASRFVHYTRIISRQFPSPLLRRYNTQQTQQNEQTHQTEHQTKQEPNDAEFSEKNVRKAIFEIASNPEIMKKLTPEERQIIESMIRVDHAGEFGAVKICKGQLAILKNDPTVQEILNEEEIHLSTFNKMVEERRVRPTALQPVWTVGAYALGAATALLGREAAMACHTAVEEAISEHYNDQLRELHTLPNGSKDTELRKIISSFRDDELHHHQLGLDNNAQKVLYLKFHNLLMHTQAPFYDILHKTIKTTCSVAIWLSKRV